MSGWDGQGLHDDTVSTNALNDDDDDEDEEEEDDDDEEEEEEESTVGGGVDNDDDEIDDDPPPRPKAMSFSDLAAVTGWDEGEQQDKGQGKGSDKEEEEEEVEAYDFESSYEDRASGLASSTEEGSQAVKADKQPAASDPHTFSHALTPLSLSP